MIRTEIRKGFYLDSVALMRAARSIAELPGIEDAGMMIGTPANMEFYARRVCWMKPLPRLDPETWSSRSGRATQPRPLQP